MSAAEPRTRSSEPDQLVATASMEEVLDAIDGMDLNAPWEDIRTHVRLVLPRRRPLPDHAGSLPQRIIGPGIAASVGLDIGPAMLFLSLERLAEWDVTPDVAFDQAITNVEAEVAARKHFALIREDIAGTPTMAFESRQGWASGLLAMPEALCRVIGQRDGLILTPMRDLVLCLPLDADRELAGWILDEFAEADMNALAVPLLALIDGRLGPATTVAPDGKGVSVDHYLH